jgi:hypothetical protein
MKEATNIVTVLNKDERYAIFWCFNQAMKYIEVDEFDNDKDVIVNGVNINETIRNLLGRLVI